VVDEEGLKRPNSLVQQRDPAVFRRRNNRHLPGRNVVRELEMDLSSAFRVGVDFRRPEQSLREVLAQARRLDRKVSGTRFLLAGSARLRYDTNLR
jgi:hypothetical protein